ncbi:DiGeorge syndrome critical region 6 (DGCR6) protein [Popillia japonica]|uniref:DiGeorge syndrome critical region 6 (DGCR6) protein n=1 Tax=Popillia japonica TaxID=7064 RepID=A0AAW1K520_POPJA
MARDLPPKYQMRIPYELLSSLANCLLNDTIFEIAKGLMEIQHVTEQHLFQQRRQFLNKIKMNEQDILDRTDMTAEEKVKKLNDMKVAQKEEVRQFDMSLVLQLDQKVADQQQTLEQAGVPGFFVTSSALDVKVQMYLLDFIFRLSKMDIPS